MRTPRGLRREDGSVLVIVALVMPVLLLAAGGGVVTFTVSAAHRELQRAADQAALAGAAALPPVDPKVIVENAPFPLPDTDPVYDMLPEDVSQSVPRMGELAPDPRVVACEVASSGNLDEDSAALINSFEDASNIQAPVGDDGSPQSTVCEDERIYPVMEPNPMATNAVECTNNLVRKVADMVPPIDASLPADLQPSLTEPIQTLVDTVVDLPLGNALPALMTPRMRVDAYTWISPPMYSLFSWFPRQQAGENFTSPVAEGGLDLHARAVAYRRIKNAVVVPILPVQTLAIEAGLSDPITTMTSDYNLNLALRTSQATLIGALDDADNRLDDVMAQLGLPCNQLLYNLRQDLRDIYSPPSGPVPTALDIVDATVEATEATAARVGEAQPDPNDPTSLAGEAFLLIGVTVDNFMDPVAATQIPILDMALVVMNEVSEGDYRAAVISAASARGVFRATLVE